MCQLRLVDLAYQRSNLLRPHRHATQHAKLQSGAHENRAQSRLERHDTPPRADSGRADISTIQRGSYAREELDGGPRDSKIARSATNCSSQRGASRVTTEVVDEGRSVKAGVTTSHSRDAPPRGRNAAKTTRAMQVTATALRGFRIASSILLSLLGSVSCLVNTARHVALRLCAVCYISAQRRSRLWYTAVSITGAGLLETSLATR